jgi:hypothetical protein
VTRCRIIAYIVNRYPEYIPVLDQLAKLPRADGAGFNIHRQNQPRCLPNTRVDVLKDIMAWTDRSDESRIFWLSGLAGTGKSTIARTVAVRLEENKQLGASFFFSRGGGDLGKAAKVFTTLAFQLAKVPCLRRSICDAIDKHLDIAEQGLYDQWKQLIFEPLSKLKANQVPQPLVFVLDALDECDGAQDVEHILQLLTEVQTLGSIQLRIFITSRPETPIRFGFNQMPGILHQDLVLQDVSPDIINNDILIFFKSEFHHIRKRYNYPDDWPAETIIDRLVQNSSRLFIWAATACRYIAEGGRFAQGRLNDILQSQSSETGPEEKLNEIYTMVLEKSIKATYTDAEKERHYNLVKRTLGTIVVLLLPLTWQSYLIFQKEMSMGRWKIFIQFSKSQKTTINRSAYTTLHSVTFFSTIRDAEIQE